jgi:hypothetical protein
MQVIAVSQRLSSTKTIAFQKIDAGDPVAAGGQEQGVFTRAAAGVEGRVSNCIEPLRLALCGYDE